MTSASDAANAPSGISRKSWPSWTAPGAALIVGDVAKWRAATIKQLEQVRDPEAFKTWNIRVIHGTGTRRRSR